MSALEQTGEPGDMTYITIHRIPNGERALDAEGTHV